MKHVSHMKVRFLFSFLALIALAGIFTLASCSSDKKDEVEETTESETIEVEVEPAPEPEAPPVPERRGRLEHQLPPELAIPCENKSEGDDCTVTVSSDREVQGTCLMTRTEKLACMPKARPGKTSTNPKPSPPPAQ